MVNPPTKRHQFAVGHDLIGNVFVAVRIGSRVDYIYGLFKGRELVGGHLDRIESWHAEGEQVPFTDHPNHGNIVLVMGIPITEIVGSEADKIISQIDARAD